MRAYAPALIVLALSPSLAAQTGVRIFDRGCGPVATWPRMAVSQGTPKINTQVTITGSLLRPSSISMTLAGASNTVWNGVRLPLMIDPRPWPPCQLLVAPEVLLPGLADRSGRQSWTLSIPNDKQLIGVKFYFQMASPATTLHMTDGLELTIY